MSAPVSHQRAILLAIAAFTCFVLSDSAIKLAGKTLPNYEIIFFLGLIIAAFTAGYALLRGDIRILRPVSLFNLTVKGVLDLANNLCVVIALRHLSLTLFYILVFTAPMLTAILGRFFLAERLDARKIAAILTGFAGVVIAVDPTHAIVRGSLPGYLACVVCVTCFASGIVWLRKHGEHESPESITFVSGAVAAIVGVCLMAGHAVPVDTRQTIVLACMGILGAVGSLCASVAVKHISAATFSQYHYSQLLSGVVVAYFLFHEPPTWPMLAGAVLIIAAGSYIALHNPSTAAALAGERTV